MSDTGAHPEPADLPRDFVTFHEKHVRVWRAYARLELGTREASDDVVHTAFTEVAGDWRRLGRPVAAHAWAVLRAHVAYRLHTESRGSALVELLPFDAWAFAELSGVKEHMQVLEDRIAFCAAIGHLPALEYDVLLLGCLLGLPRGTVAETLGITPQSVHALDQAGLGRIGAELGLVRLDIPAITDLVLRMKKQDFARMDSRIGLYAAIARLPRRQYEVIVLCYVLSYSYEKAAYLLGLEPATVRSHVRSAKKTLNRALASYTEPE